ncbi:serine/threonine-protein phosphatase 2A 56 kDa regulatory subunit delta isoform [Dispira simplex]|nr:serine/threonine-protein phosphatase 2A 56 kDa regulatory subunit delta isoform [Dispira simplex]
MKFASGPLNAKSNQSPPTGTMPTNRSGSQSEGTSIPRVVSLHRLKSIPTGSIPVMRASPVKSIMSRFQENSPQTWESLPQFSEVAEGARRDLFKKKLEQCCILFDFSDPSSNLIYKEAKQHTLVDLVDYISMNRGVLYDDIYPLVFSMFAINLFRPIPPQVNPMGEQFDPDDDDPVLEVAWPHLQIVYVFFLRFIESPDFNANVASQCINEQFVQHVLDLFDSEDPREREYLKTTLHRIYGKFLRLRAFIRRCISNIFLHFVYEQEKHHGIAELLEILGSIINGFALPLKEEHRQFLVRVLLPLHKAKSLIVYYQPLCYCTLQFLQKDPTLTDKVIQALLRYWPKVNSPKEVMFLNELEDLVLSVDEQYYVGLCVPMFKQLARCMASPHFQVADRALKFWQNEHHAAFIARHRQTILPIIFPVLIQYSKGHWNRNVHQQMYHTLQYFMEDDPSLFDRCLQQAKEHRHQEKQQLKKRNRFWKRLEQMAQSQRQPHSTDTPATSAGKKAGETSNTNVVTGPVPDALLMEDDESSMSPDEDNEMDDILNALSEPLPITSGSSRMSLERRKSVLPIDEQVLRELSNYKSPESAMDIHINFRDPLVSPTTPTLPGSSHNVANMDQTSATTTSLAAHDLNMNSVSSFPGS